MACLLPSGLVVLSASRSSLPTEGSHETRETTVRDELFAEAAEEVSVVTLGLLGSGFTWTVVGA